MTARHEGLHIALLGIDGAGKTSVASALAESLRERGRAVRVTSWKDIIAHGDDASRNVLASISMGAYKLQFSEAIAQDGTRAFAPDLEVDSVKHFFTETEAKLREQKVLSNRPAPFLAAALLEIAGSHYLHHACIRQFVKSGTVVIEESCGFKHALKNALLAIRVADATSDEAQRIIELASLSFGSSLSPDHGFWVDADPQLARRWRERAEVADTNFEDYGLAGEAKRSFLDMQADCRIHFEEFANRWSWTRVPMNDRPKAENVVAALRTIAHACELT